MSLEQQFLHVNEKKCFIVGLRWNPFNGTKMGSLIGFWTVVYIGQ